MNSHFKEQVDRLTALIHAGVGRKSEPQKLRLSEEIDNYRLGIMILKMHEGQLEPKYIFRLARWLECDERALKYYIEFNHLSAMLRSLYTAKEKAAGPFHLTSR